MLDSSFYQRLCEMIERCYMRNLPQYTDFLDPVTQVEVAALCTSRGVKFALEGGYSAAERRVLCLLPDYQDEPDREKLLCCFQVRGEKPFAHPDLLGALLGLGVKRSTVGDLCLSQDEKGRGTATVYCLQRVSPLLLSLCDVGRQSVQSTPLPFSSVPKVAHEDAAIVSKSVASLRFDAVLSIAFDLARSQSAALIESGEARLNWQECRDRSRILQIGDSISVHRHGRATLLSINGRSRKERHFIKMHVFK